jgi:RNA polymerase sigma-70 factor (ECF subfamily)
MGRSSDSAGLDHLVSSHLAEALRLATRLTGDPETAEEVVAEALARVAGAWSSFRGRSTFRTWLFRIVINAFRDYCAARRPTEPLCADVPDDRTAGPAQQAMADELGRMIAASVSALPPRQREVLVLVTYEGLSPREAAEVLGISEANVYSTLYTARKRLRRQLAPYLLEK